MHALSRLKVHFPHLQELFNGVATSQELHRSFKVKTNGKRQYSFHDFHCHCHFFYSLPYSQWFAPRGLSKKASPTITASSQTSPSNSPTKELPTINVSVMYTICAATATTGPINLYYTIFRFIELAFKIVKSNIFLYTWMMWHLVVTWLETWQQVMWHVWSLILSILGRKSSIRCGKI